ncbi:hypothetical protein [Candidatus Enterococcus mansonii]|uniref:Uncharacterized protein n=1 Tax=Candidatus Enterococcus mansonii TaxID=1834181 RepID=A0A242CIH9_9ENTE|nr:hypothetical protein [Enterococcus sp. 4G2_DIV0659]OTO09969.1 hypothetical protein A5880_000652 [Enterococcus sp. 4G2_DIV0659]
MINEMNRKVNRLNKKLGVKVELSELSNRQMKRSAVINLVLGTVLIGTGAYLDRNDLFFLGGLGLFGSAVLGIESRKIQKQSK